MHDSRARANVVRAYICVYKSSTVPPFSAGNMVKTSRLDNLGTKIDYL